MNMKRNEKENGKKLEKFTKKKLKNLTLYIICILRVKKNALKYQKWLPGLSLTSTPAA